MHKLLVMTIAMLCLMARAGDNITQDIELAKLVTILKVDCNTGNSKCCAKLGDMYFLGKQGLTKDINKARPFLYKACGAGIQLSCQQLHQIQ